MFNIRNICMGFIFILLMSSLSVNESTLAAVPPIQDYENQTVVVVQPEAEEYWCGNVDGLLGFNTLDAVGNLILALGFRQQVAQLEPEVTLVDQPVAAVTRNVPASMASPNKNGNDANVSAETNNIEVSRGGGRTITMVATGYTDAPEENYPWAGAPSYIGLPLARGIVAVDPNVIPMGTKLYIEGYGEGIAADQGGAIKGNRIDLFFDSKAEAYSWGMRTIKVTVYP